MYPKEQQSLYSLPVGAFFKSGADTLLCKVINQRLGTTYKKDPGTGERIYPRDADGNIIYHIPTTCYIFKSAYSDNFIRVTKRDSHLKNVIRWEVSDIESDKYEEAMIEFQKEINYE